MRKKFLFLMIMTNLSPNSFALDLGTNTPSQVTIEKIFSNSLKYEELITEKQKLEEQLKVLGTTVQSTYDNYNKKNKSLKRLELKCSSHQSELQEVVNQSVQLFLKRWDSKYRPYTLSSSIDHEYVSKFISSLNINYTNEQLSFIAELLLEEIGRDTQKIETMKLKFIRSDEILQTHRDEYEKLPQGLTLGAFNYCDSSLKFLDHSPHSEFLKFTEILPRAKGHRFTDILKLAKYGGFKKIGASSYSSSLKEITLEAAINRLMQTEDSNNIRSSFMSFFKGAPTLHEQADYLLSLYKPGFQIYNNSVDNCLNEESQKVKKRISKRAEIKEVENYLENQWNNNTEKIQDFLSIKLELEKKVAGAKFLYETYRRRKESVQRCNLDIKNLSRSKSEIISKVTKLKLEIDKLSTVASKNDTALGQFEITAKKIVELKKELIVSPNDSSSLNKSMNILMLEHSLETDSDLDYLFSSTYSLSNNFNSGDLTSLKENYETALSKRTGKVAVYNKKAANIFDPLINNKVQCYSGTLLFLASALHNSEVLNLNDVVVILTNGHILPGFIEKNTDSSTLFGIETTATGPAIVEYGQTNKIFGKIRVVKLKDFLVIEALKNELTNIKPILEATANNLKNFGFSPQSLLAYDNNVNQFNSLSTLNRSPFGFGTANVVEGDINRTYISSMSLAGDYLKGDGTHGEHIYESAFNPGEVEVFYRHLEIIGLGLQLESDITYNSFAYPYSFGWCQIEERTVTHQKYTHLMENLKFKASSQLVFSCTPNNGSLSFRHQLPFLNNLNKCEPDVVDKNIKPLFSSFVETLEGSPELSDNFKEVIRSLKVEAACPNITPND